MSVRGMHDSAAGANAAAGLWFLVALAAAGFVAAALRQRRQGRRWSGWRTVSFLTGCSLIAVAVAPPLVAWAHHDLRGHMVQHLLLGMFAPLGLVLSAPGTLLLRTLPVSAARRISAVLRSGPVGVLTHPGTALILDAGGLYLLYLTPLFAATLASPLLHGVVHLHFLAAGSLFAWSVARPDPSPHRPSFRTRLGALFIAVAAHSTLAKVMYAYGWPRGTHYDAERIGDAAQLMYYGGDLAELLLAVALFASWYRASASPRNPSAVQTQPRLDYAR